MSTLAAAPTDLDRWLAADRALVAARLREVLPDREPRRYLYDLVADYPQRPSGAMRPVLCLASCRAHGGATEDALDVAVAIELLHNAFLVHDDIEDGSTRRRGQATLASTHGVPLAINAGDGLVALALRVVVGAAARLSTGTARQLLSEFAHLMQATVEGQAVELGWVADERFDISDTDYLAMVRDKTCWYSTIHPLRVGALVGSNGGAILDGLDAIGFFLGSIFQIEDDIANLAIGRRHYGKDLGGDIIEGKRTLMLLHLVRTASAKDRATILRCVGPRASGSRDTRIRTVVELMRTYGSIDHAQAYKDALAGAALAEVRRTFDTRAGKPIVQLLLSMVLRLRRGDPSVFGASSVAPSAGAEPFRLGDVSAPHLAPTELDCVLHHELP